MCQECEEHNPPSEVADLAELYVDEYADETLEMLASQAEEHGLANNRRLQIAIMWFSRFITRENLPRGSR